MTSTIEVGDVVRLLTTQYRGCVGVVRWVYDDRSLLVLPIEGSRMVVNVLCEAEEVEVLLEAKYAKGADLEAVQGYESIRLTPSRAADRQGD